MISWRTPTGTFALTGRESAAATAAGTTCCAAAIWIASPVPPADCSTALFAATAVACEVLVCVTVATGHALLRAERDEPTQQVEEVGVPAAGGQAAGAEDVDRQVEVERRREGQAERDRHGLAAVGQLARHAQTAAAAHA